MIWSILELKKERGEQRREIFSFFFILVTFLFSFYMIWINKINDLKMNKSDSEKTAFLFIHIQLLFANFAPEDILTLLLARLHRNIFTLLPGHLSTVLCRNIQTHLDKNMKIFFIEDINLIPLLECSCRLLLVLL